MKALLQYFDQFPQPWTVAPRTGKHYGTIVIDSNGDEVQKFWTAEGEPSEREKAYFGRWPVEDFPCDSHWECQTDYDAAIEFCDLPRVLAAML